MTLEYLQPTGSFVNAIKFTINTPSLAVGQYTMNVTSRYENQPPMINTISLVFDLTIDVTNDRYTEFMMDYDPSVGTADLSGLYDYEIKNSLDEVVDAGLLKIQNDKDESLQNKDKYTGPNDSAKSYVII